MGHRAAAVPGARGRYRHRSLQENPVLDLDEWRAWPIFNNSPTAWLIAGAITLGSLMLLLALRPMVRRYAKRLHATERSEVLEIPMAVLSRTTLPFLVILSMYLGLRSLELGEPLQVVLNSAITIALFWQAGVWAAAAVRAWVDRRKQHSVGEDRAALSSLGIISFIASLLIWALVLLLTLDNLGVNITALVAGLGIGGVAVALALQNVLGDLFASLSIALDRPFVVGDFLAIDTFLGSVEYIGIKTTRLRSLDGEQIILSNSDILKSRVRNYGRMVEKRVQFATRVSHTASVETIEKIPRMIREAIESQEKTRFDRSHFLRHGDASLEFETVYYVLSPDYNLYMDIQQAINLRIHRGLAELGVEFAVPTQKLVLTQKSRPADEPDADDDGSGDRRRRRGARAHN
jgi:small-conductance mechanosensitive channel